VSRGLRGSKLIPSSEGNPKAREVFAAKRTNELKECGDKVQALLQEYDVELRVTEVRRYPGGQVTVMHQIEVVSR
jgi:hypothetical protein